MSDKYSYVPSFYRDGILYREAFSKNGKLHREGDLPAQIWYNESGEVSLE